jgi:hypothetical protein
MHLDQIRTNLAAHNRAQAKPKPKPKPKPKAKPKSQPRPQTAVFACDELLRQTTERIVTALGLEEKGVTVEQILRHVHNYETPSQVVQ